MQKNEHDELLEQLHEFEAQAHPVFSSFSLSEIMKIESTLIHEFRKHGFQAELDGPRHFSIKGDGTVQKFPYARLIEKIDTNREHYADITVASVQDFILDKPLQEYNDADFYRGVRVRLRPKEEITPHAITQEFNSDMAIGLYFDSLTSQRELTKENTTHRGRLEDLFHIGYRNTFQELQDAQIDSERITPDGPPQPMAEMPNGEPINPSQSHCFYLTGESNYIASILLFLEEILSAPNSDFLKNHLESADTSHGIIFSTPADNILFIREVTSGTELMNSIGLAATLTAEAYVHAETTLSPRLHIWHEGTIETFTDLTWDEEKRQAEIQVQPTPYLLSRINEDLQ